MTPCWLHWTTAFPHADDPQNGLFVAHGLEALRLGFAGYYHAAPELSLPYLHGCALVLLFFGLALHVRFQRRLVSQ